MCEVTQILIFSKVERNLTKRNFGHKNKSGEEEKIKNFFLKFC